MDFVEISCILFFKNQNSDLLKRDIDRAVIYDERDGIFFRIVIINR